MDHRMKLFLDDIEKATGLGLCGFNDECDFCKRPEGRVYAKLIYNPEDVTETDYYVCEKCIKTNKDFIKKYL